MTDFASMLQPDRGESARTVHLVDKDSFDAWVTRQGDAVQALLAAARFDGKKRDRFALLPKGNELEVVASVGAVGRLTPWCLAKLAEDLPEGRYRLANGDAGIAALGWLLGQHRFDRYRTSGAEERDARVLLTSDPATISGIVRQAEATALVRDLVDTPAADMGPAELEHAARELAKKHSAKIHVTSGDVLAKDYPMIQAVGQGASRERAPRLIELHWGKDKDPAVTIIGKGVCFDSGGLDIKSAGSMRLMKKDMGGAAHALALAGLVMGEGLPVKLHLLIPAVENSVSGTAFRPGDIIDSRKGLKVEIDNTDAEGRLVLGDALTRAGDEKPELVIDFATLTGAARVALGPDLPATFANDEEVATGLVKASTDAGDPIWRMPLWDGYDEMLKSDIADLANSSSSSFAGCITAALFLRRFVPEGAAWAHFDTFAWRPAAKPGRPKGGDAMGLRAAFAYLRDRYTKA